MKVVISLLIVALIAVVVISPLAVIWAINTLFGTELAYTLSNWTAIWILCSVFSPSISYRNKRD